MSCKSSIGCIDSHVVPVVPVRATYINLYKYPESDAEFVKAVLQKRNHLGTNRTGQHGPVIVDSYSCRQMYLRSYTFSKKETMPQKTMRWLSRVRETASQFSFIHKSDNKGNKSENKGNKNKKCGGIKRLVSSLFHRVILSCTSGVDVVDGNYKSSVKRW